MIASAFPTKGQQMARERIPAGTKTEILNEFRHRCAVCGRHEPQVHHIDRDATNNAIENLIPLCPNCHLTDQHSPTSQVEPRKLRLFRQYKDPAILSSQFEPLFRRMTFLFELETNVIDYFTLNDAVHDLCRFVACVEMGQYYGPVLRELIGNSVHYSGSLMEESDSQRDLNLMRAAASFKEEILQHRSKVIALCVELLRFQSWTVDAAGLQHTA